MQTSQKRKTAELFVHAALCGDVRRNSVCIVLQIFRTHAERYFSHNPRFCKTLCMYKSAETSAQSLQQNYVEISAVNLLTFRPNFCTQHYAGISPETLHTEFCVCYARNCACRIPQRFRPEFCMQDSAELSPNRDFDQNPASNNTTKVFAESRRQNILQNCSTIVRRGC